MKVFSKKKNSYYLIALTIVSFGVVFFQNCSKTPYAKSPITAAKK